MNNEPDFKKVGNLVQRHPSRSREPTRVVRCLTYWINALASE